MIDHYINPALGDMPLRSVRAEHLDRFYRDRQETGGAKGKGQEEVNPRGTSIPWRPAVFRLASEGSDVQT